MESVCIEFFDSMDRPHTSLETFRERHEMSQDDRKEVVRIRENNMQSTIKYTVESVVKWTLIAFILFILLLYASTTISWSPSETQIKEDFKSYWKKICAVFQNSTLLEMRIAEKSIGLNRASVIIQYSWEKKKKEDGENYKERHNSEIKFIYQKYEKDWKLVQRVDTKFF